MRTNEIDVRSWAVTLTWTVHRGAEVVVRARTAEEARARAEELLDEHPETIDWTEAGGDGDMGVEAVVRLEDCEAAARRARLRSRVWSREDDGVSRLREVAALMRGA